ncbi:hypothetical protein CFOL_v3_16340 [Cephalotus follicularis]|uniref:Uncharacterized protein n=1 Tax=Cephalotus follicularis TaxID=3775 RepID=A0A1Q3BY89_CEPFO|nr:hypothetical protein CFOL_v3_16340 [Cephalotus follicularis]
MIPKPLRVLGTGAALIVGGVATLRLVSSFALGAIGAIVEKRQKKFALPCGQCKGRGFYMCKLCKGNATIQWSPLSDPLFINPCLCPTCDGHRVQRCLNCLGKGYY